MLHQTLCIISKPWMNSNWSYSPETHNLDQNWQLFILCDLEILRMALKNNRAPLLCCLKFCASFRSHQWIQTRVAVRKHPIWVKINDFLALWPWNLTYDLENQKGTSPKQHQAMCTILDHIWIQTGVAVRKRQILVKIDGFLAVWPWNLTSDLDILHGRHFYHWW